MQREKLQKPTPQGKGKNTPRKKNKFSYCSLLPLEPPLALPATKATQITLDSQSKGNSSHLSVTKEADRLGEQQTVCT